MNFEFDRKLDVYDSENIDEVYYCFQDQRMVVRFVTAAMYSYQRVPANIFAEIAGSDSVGQKLRKLVFSFPEIYKYERID